MSKSKPQTAACVGCKWPCYDELVEWRDIAMFEGWIIEKQNSRELSFPPRMPRQRPSRWKPLQVMTLYRVRCVLFSLINNSVQDKNFAAPYGTPRHLLTILLQRDTITKYILTVFKRRMHIPGSTKRKVILKGHSSTYDSSERLHLFSSGLPRRPRT